MQPRTCLCPLAHPAADDQRFLPNITGDSVGSALLLFSTLVGHDKSTCADCRDLDSIGRESARQVWRVDTAKLRRAIKSWWLFLKLPAASGSFTAVISEPPMTGSGL
jgi:hypothetical protein